VARRQLDDSTITAPAGGTILRIHTRAGEAVGTKPLLQMADLSRMACVAEVFESDVKRIEIGQRAVIRSAALPPPYDADGMAGTVVRVGNVIATPELRSLDPFAQYDRHVVEVRIDLPTGESAIAATLVNLQVEVTFLAKPRDEE
jgi:HlyD family secretion protein